MTILGKTEWGWCSDGTIDLVFTNLLTGATETRNYKSERSAKGAETKFFKRLERVNRNRIADRIEVHIPGLDYEED